MLTIREREVLEVFSEGVKEILALLGAEPCHPADLAEAVAHIHGVQNIIMARGTVRSDLARFTHLQQFCGLAVPGTAPLICVRNHE